MVVNQFMLQLQNHQVRISLPEVEPSEYHGWIPVAWRYHNANLIRKDLGFGVC